MRERTKLVFFDFCETLIKFQTADKYIDFCRNRLLHKRMLFLQIATNILTKLYFFRVLGRIVPNNTLRKRLILSQLKNVDYSTLNRLAEEYYRQCLKPSIIPQMMERLLLHLQSNDKVWIISGGYNIQ